MNKKTKGLAAIVLGGALVLGTGGTFALWHASDIILGADASTGHLTLDADHFDWNLEHFDEESELVVTPFDPGTETLFAGQTLVGVAELNPVLAGSFMVADLEFDISVTMGNHTFERGVPHNGITVDWADDSSTGFTGLIPGDSADRVYVVVDVGSGNQTDNVTVNIAPIQVTLAQRAPTA